MKKNSISYDERMKRFWHYWNMKNATEEMIETSSGELRIIIDALADYHDIVMEKVKTMEGYMDKSCRQDQEDSDKIGRVYWV